MEDGSSYITSLTAKMGIRTIERKPYQIWNEELIIGRKFPVTFACDAVKKSHRGNNASFLHSKKSLVTKNLLEEVYLGPNFFEVSSEE